MITSFECRLCQGQFSTFDALNQHWRDSPCGLSSRTSKDHVIAVSSDGQVVALANVPLESAEMMQETSISDVTPLGNEVEVSISGKGKLESCGDPEAMEDTSPGDTVVGEPHSTPEDPSGVSLVTSLMQVEVSCVQTEVEPVVSESMSDGPIILAQEVSPLDDVGKGTSVDAIVTDGILHNQQDESLNDGILHHASQMTQPPSLVHLAENAVDREAVVDIQMPVQTQLVVNEYGADNGKEPNENQLYIHEVDESNTHGSEKDDKSLDAVLSVPQIPWLMEDHKDPMKLLKQKHKKHLGSKMRQIEKRFCCEVCGMTYAKSSNLYRHMQVHSGEKNICEKCNKSFRYAETLRTHRNSCHANPHLPTQFNCKLCSDVFKSPSRLTIHMMTHYPEKLLKCEVCQKAFWTKTGLTRHALIHKGRKSYKCDVCDKTFLMKYSLKRHKFLHAVPMPFACSICKWGFASRNSLRNHQIVHNPDRPYICQFCSESFKTAQSLRTHNIIHTRAKRHPCTKCLAKFGTQKEMNMHMRTHWKAELKDNAQLERHQCRECGAKFTQSGSLRAHERSHSGERRYNCSICDKSFIYYSSWYQHMRVHRGEKRYVCKKCKRGFTKKQYLTRHKNGLCPGRCHNNKPTESEYAELQDGDVQGHETDRLPAESSAGTSVITISSNADHVSKCQESVKSSILDNSTHSSDTLAATEKVISRGSIEVLNHTIKFVEVKSFVCEMCGKMYKSSSNLQRHRRTHEEKKPFVCKICGKGYSRKPILKEHESVAHGKWDTTALHKCPDCPMSYPTKARLAVHRRKHTGERPYKCQFCSKAFKEGGNLKRHERIHSDLKPFKCVVCGRGFNDQGNLQKHEVTHGIKGQEDRAKAGSWKPFSCPDCGKSFKQLGYLRYHQRVHQQDILHCCTVCNRSFTQAANLKLHMKSHTEKPFRCHICCKSYRKESKLENHIETCHAVKKCFVCRNCGKELSSKASLQRHEETHKGPKEVKEHDCPVCKISFQKEGTLYQHLEMHKDDLFNCDKCQRIFTSQDVFNEHAKKCGSSSIYKCKLCDRTFSLKKGLTLHQRTHKSDSKVQDKLVDKEHRQKFFICGVCHVSFSQKKLLSKHQRVHTKPRLSKNKHTKE